MSRTGFRGAPRPVNLIRGQARSCSAPRASPSPKSRSPGKNDTVPAKDGANLQPLQFQAFADRIVQCLSHRGDHARADGGDMPYVVHRLSVPAWVE